MLINEGGYVAPNQNTLAGAQHDVGSAGAAVNPYADFLSMGTRSQQRILANNGFRLNVDGQMGPVTRNAIHAYVHGISGHAWTRGYYNQAPAPGHSPGNSGGNLGIPNFAGGSGGNPDIGAGNGSLGPTPRWQDFIGAGNMKYLNPQLMAQLMSNAQFNPAIKQATDNQALEQSRGKQIGTSNAQATTALAAALARIGAQSNAAQSGLAHGAASLDSQLAQGQQGNSAAGVLAGNNGRMLAQQLQGNRHDLSMEANRLDMGNRAGQGLIRQNGAARDAIGKQLVALQGAKGSAYATDLQAALANRMNTIGTAEKIAALQQNTQAQTSLLGNQIQGGKLANATAAQALQMRPAQQLFQDSMALRQYNLQAQQIQARMASGKGLDQKTIQGALDTSVTANLGSDNKWRTTDPNVAYHNAYTALRGQVGPQMAQRLAQRLRDILSSHMDMGNVKFNKNTGRYETIGTGTPGYGIDNILQFGNGSGATPPNTPGAPGPQSHLGK